MHPRLLLSVMGVGAILVLTWLAIVTMQPTEVTAPEQFSLKTPLVSSSDPALGPSNAALTIVEFGDALCSACKDAGVALKQLMKETPDQIRLVWKDLPLDEHPNSEIVAEATHCAGEQGKFWQYQDLLFQNQDELNSTLDPSLLGTFARALSLNATRFSRCLEQHTYRDNIRLSKNEARSLKVDAVPYFFVNGTRFSGDIKDLRNLMVTAP